MNEGVSGNVVKIDDDSYSCAVDNNSDSKGVLSKMECLSGENGDVLANDGGSILGKNSSLVRSAGNDNLEEVENVSCDLSVGYIVAAAILLAVAILACAILVVLASKGIIGIPGVDTETMSFICEAIVTGFFVGSSLCLLTINGSFVDFFMGILLCSYWDLGLVVN